jgi:hypothetical protein
MNTVSLVDQYYALAAKGADFSDPRLVALREQMTGADLVRVMARLKDASAAADKEAEEMGEYIERKFDSP